MTDLRQSARWLSRVVRGEGRIYQAVLQAMESAIRAGELQPGDQLPTQRQVAGVLAIDITTVTRAYNEAANRGWIEGAVGRGTFVSAKALDDELGLVDLSMNLPPPPDGASLGAMLRETTHAILQRSDAARLMTYHPGAGSLAQQAAGAGWLEPCLGAIDPERLLVTAGAQTALAALLNHLCSPGDRIITEPLSYPGFKHIAARAGVTLVACPVDEQGFLPDRLQQLCQDHDPKAIYVVPTMQNPTAATMSPGRRSELAKIAGARGVWIIEDDPYSRLLAAPPPAVATFAPERTFYIATLAKCLSPGLRVAYVVCPSSKIGAELADVLRSLVLMPAPLMTAVVTSWMRDGSAQDLLSGVRREAIARRRIAAKILPDAVSSVEEGIHVWLDLSPDWHGQTLRHAAQARGLSLVTAEAFATGPEHRNGVRISLGGSQSRDVLTTALGGIAELVKGPPAARAHVV